MHVNFFLLNLSSRITLPPGDKNFSLHIPACLRMRGRRPESRQVVDTAIAFKEYYISSCVSYMTQSLMRMASLGLVWHDLQVWGTIATSRRTDNAILRIGKTPAYTDALLCRRKNMLPSSGLLHRGFIAASRSVGIQSFFTIVYSFFRWMSVPRLGAYHDHWYLQPI